MHFSPVLLAAAGLLDAVAAQVYSQADIDSGQAYSQADIDSGQALSDMSKTAYDNAMGRVASGESGDGCTPDNVRVRKEWYVFPPHAW